MAEKLEKLARWHDKNFKLLLVIPLILLVISLGYISYFYVQTGDFINKDISLTGGTTITIFSEQLPADFEAKLSERVDDYSLRSVSDFRTGQQLAMISYQPELCKYLYASLKE